MGKKHHPLPGVVCPPNFGSPSIHPVLSCGVLCCPAVISPTQWRRYTRACQVKCSGYKASALACALRAFAKFAANDLPYNRTDMEMTWLS